MTRHHRSARSTTFLLLLLATLLLPAVGWIVPNTATAVEFGAGGTFVPLTPARLLTAATWTAALET